MVDRIKSTWYGWDH